VGFVRLFTDEFLASPRLVFFLFPAERESETFLSSRLACGLCCFCALPVPIFAIKGIGSTLRRKRNKISRYATAQPNFRGNCGEGDSIARTDE
jgi:hypothetical protein